MVSTGSQNELCFSKLPSSHSCVSRGVTCCSPNQARFAWTTLSNKHQWNAGSSQGCSQKNFSEPLYFYRPFGDSSAISSSILKRESTPPVGLVCGWIWKRETQTLIGKVDVPHIVLFFINISTVMLFSNSWTKTQLFLSCLQFWLCQTHLQHFKAHWASRLHTQWDTVHQVTRS